MSVDEIFSMVRTAIAETMCDEALEVGPSMTLMGDLEMESIDVLDLQFRLEARFGFRVPGINAFQEAETDAEGRFTVTGMKAIEKLLPDSLLRRFRARGISPTPKELWDEMTVDDLVNIIRMGKVGRDSRAIVKNVP